MPLGQWAVITSGTGQQLRVPSGNYLWPTIRIMNPNDGVLYVKQNAPVTDTGYGSWDYKCPAQSFGILPSEGVGWQSAGVFYQDQSGTDRPGEVAMYLSMQTVAEPTFVAIGRSIVSQSTSLDIVQGSQPANPGTGYTRLWIDTTNHLHLLPSTGADNIVLDSTNYATYTGNTPMGGDLYGSINAAHISVQSGNNIIMANGTYVQWSDCSVTRWNATQIGLRGTGGVTIQGPLSIEGNSGLTTGTGSTASFGGNVTTQGGITAAQSIISQASGIYNRDSGGTYYAGPSDSTQFGLWNPGELRVKSPSSGNLRTAGSVISEGGPCQGNGAYVNTASSITLKKNVEPLVPAKALELVLHAGIEPCYFEFTDPFPVTKYFGRDEKEPDPDAPSIIFTDRKIGFITEQVQTVIPEAAGMIEGTDKGFGLITESLVPLLWSAIRALNERMDRAGLPDI